MCPVMYIYLMVCTQLKIVILLHNHWNRKWVYLHVFVTRSHEFYSGKSIVAEVPKWILLKQIWWLGLRILCSKDRRDSLVRKDALTGVCNITGPPRKYPTSSLKYINFVSISGALAGDRREHKKCEAITK